MAFRPIYGLNVYLTAATAPAAGALQIDNNLAVQLATALGGDYTYAAMSDGVNYELIRIDSVSAPLLNVTRGVDGTLTSGFPIGTCIRFVWTAEGIEAVAAGGNLVLTGTGAVTATQTGTNAWTVGVPVTTIEAVALPIEVLGDFPAFEIGFQGTSGGCCCGSGATGGSGSPVVITGTGLADVTGADNTFNVGVLPPNFIGANGITVSGAWPNITFTGTGVVPPSGVATVNGSAKITISGTLTNPVVNLNTTGVGTNTFNGVTFDNWGTITHVDVTYIPLTTITTATACVSLTSISDGVLEIDVLNGSVGTAGALPLAAPTAGGSNNPGDAASAVSPAGINAVLAAYVPPAGTPVSVLNSSTYTPDVPGNYTTALSSSISTPALVAGQNLFVEGYVEVVDSATPGIPPTWGLAIFSGATLLQGIVPIVTSSHKISFVLGGVLASQTLTLRVSTLTGTSSVVAQSLTSLFLPA